MQKNREELKAKFVTDAMPTEGDFGDVFDSVFLPTEDRLNANSIDGMQDFQIVKEKNMSGGYVGLNQDGKVPAEHLPEYSNTNIGNSDLTLTKDRKLHGDGNSIDMFNFKNIIMSGLSKDDMFAISGFNSISISGKYMSLHTEDFMNVNATTRISVITDDFRLNTTSLGGKIGGEAYRNTLFFIDEQNSLRAISLVELKVLLGIG